MLTLRHLTIFKTVAETGNFTKAAQKLYITQSAVSHTIRELEEYTGTSLFDRLSRQVRLTAQGRLLLDEILPILASCDALEERIRHLEMQAPLRIVSSITIAAFWLPRILNQLKEKLPDLLPTSLWKALRCHPYLVKRGSGYCFPGRSPAPGTLSLYSFFRLLPGNSMRSRLF